MKSSTLLMAGIAISAFCAGTTQADPFGTTADLYRMCRSSVPIENASCTAYLLGFWEGMDNTSGALKGRSVFCNSASVSAGILRETFVAWVGRHPNLPQKYAKNGFLAATEAFLEAYACSRPSSDPSGSKKE